MPYVEGYGTWPFGEEWLWEAVATCYLPLLDVLGAARRAADAVAHAGAVRPARGAGRAGAARALPARGAARHARARRRRLPQRRARALGARAGARGRRLRARAGAASSGSAATCWGRSRRTRAGPRRRRTPCCRCWRPTPACGCSSSAGSPSHRARFDAAREWAGGFWLPECAHAPWLDPLLEEAGVHATCVDLTDVLGRGAPAHLAPIATDDGPLLVPIDRATIELVWSDDGYPCHDAYRDYHAFTVHHHRVWRNDGATYDHAAALAQARADAADFVAPHDRAARRGRRRARPPGARGLRARHRAARPLVVRGDRLARRGDRGGRAPGARARAARRGARRATRRCRSPRARRRATGAARRRRRARRAVADDHVGDAARPLHVGRSAGRRPRLAGARGGAARARARAPASAVAERELLLLQASDWAFQVTRELAGSYPRERAAGHRAALEAALAAEARSRSGRFLVPSAGIAGIFP